MLLPYTALNPARTFVRHSYCSAIAVWPPPRAADRHDRRLWTRRIAYNSCANRHCPKCQSLKRAAWVLAASDLILDLTRQDTARTLQHRLRSYLRPTLHAIDEDEISTPHPLSEPRSLQAIAALSELESAPGLLEENAEPCQLPHRTLA